GSPRRDTALLAQVAGFVALTLGLVAGRALGPAGEAWFGSAWGVLPAAGTLVPHGFGGVFLVLAVGAAGLSLYAAGLALRAWGRRRSARARALLETCCVYLTIAGLGAAVVGTEHAAAAAAWLAPAGALGLLALAGPRRLVLSLGLDLVGVLRLVVVGGAALLVCDAVFGRWIDPGFLDVTVGALVVVVAALAAVADPAHMAMGVPYDLALGGRRLGRPFEPFARRARDAGGAEDFA
ncbi:MAG: hypothetical protein O2894_12370, partial [Planctomycetota bacterium]|nr:hypothetical protein [Planctomycetota bacterium]